MADFLTFTGVKNKNQYQLRKVLNNLRSFQELGPLIQQFYDIHFRSSIMFPVLEVEKQGRAWMVIIVIGVELYCYNYPFSFPNSFITCQNKHNTIVVLKLIQSISSLSLQKKFYVETFLAQFPISNQKKTEVKKLILISFNELENNKLIQAKFKIIKKNDTVIETNKLNL